MEVIEEKPEEVKTEEVKVEAEAEVEVAVETNLKDKKGKKKIVTNPEDDEKNKLHIPENATTLAEWKEKNQRKGPQYKEIKVEVNLEPVSKPKDETIQVQSKKPTGEKKKKTKAVDSKEVELNKLVNLKLEDDSQRNYQGKHYTKSKQNKGFKFDKEEFPSLS